MNRDEVFSDAIVRFPRISVLVVGDVMLDSYVHGNAERLSPEAPVPVVEFGRREARLGGAANAAANLTRLGGSATVVGVIGDDGNGIRLIEALKSISINALMTKDPSRPTTTKTRIVVGGHQLLRVDEESRSPCSAEIEEAVVRDVEGAMGTGIDAVIISDYSKGIFFGNVAQRVLELALAQGIPTVVDPKGTRYSRYRGATVITPNVSEVGTALAEPVDNSNLADAVQRLRHDLGGMPVLVTKGADGVELFTDGRQLSIPAAVSDVFDVTGAGDTVVATLSLGLAAMLDLPHAAYLANLAAGAVVRERGTATVSVDALLGLIGRSTSDCRTGD